MKQQTMTAKKFFVPVFFALMSGCLSCTGVKSGGTSPAPQLTLTQTSVSSGKGSQFIRVTTSDSWTLQADAAWVSLNPASGSGSKADIVLTYEANAGEASRSVKITLSAGPQSVSAVMTQEAGRQDGQEDDPGNEGNQGGQTTVPSASVVTGEASDVDTYGATLHGSFSRATGTVRETGFEWGGTESLGETLQSSQTFSGENGSFSAELDGLGDGRTYWYRAYTVMQVGDDIRYFYGETLSFTTLKEDKPVTAAGWAELPLMDMVQSDGYLVDRTDPQVYYAYHITPDLNNAFGKRARNYTVCFSAEHHSPLWVAAPLHTFYKGSTDRSEAYKPDPDIPAEIQYLSEKGAAGLANYTRGHMLGSSDRNVTLEVNKQVYYYSNIAPQQSTAFNTGGGRWNSLEEWVDKQFCSDTLYAVIGAYYEDYTDAYGVSGEKKKLDKYAGRDDVSNPTMFYYVLLRTKQGNSGKSVMDCSAAELKCVAMVRAHAGVKQKVTSQEMMSVADLEKITGFTYFANVPNAPKDTFNASDWGL